MHCYRKYLEPLFVPATFFTRETYYLIGLVYGIEDGKNPVQHVHLYCQWLVGLAANDGDFTLQIRDRGYALRSMYVFAAEM